MLYSFKMNGLPRTDHQTFERKALINQRNKTDYSSTITFGTWMKLSISVQERTYKNKTIIFLLLEEYSTSNASMVQLVSALSLHRRIQFFCCCFHETKVACYKKGTGHKSLFIFHFHEAYPNLP